MTCLVPGCANAPRPGKRVCGGCWGRLAGSDKQAVRMAYEAGGVEAGEAQLLHAIARLDWVTPLVRARFELTTEERAERAADCRRWMSASGEERARLMAEYNAKWKGR